MDDNHSHFSLFGKTPLYQLFFSLIIILVVGLSLFTCLLLAGILIFKADVTLLVNPSLAFSRNEVGFLKYILFSQQISLFIVPAIIILNMMNHGSILWIKYIRKPQIYDLILVVMLTLFIIPVISFTGLLNSGMNLPDWLSGIEQWMTEKEEYAESLEELIMGRETFWLMLINVFLIAVIPAIGEELIFRGVFQKILNNLFNSGHLAVWVTAFLFSALHFRFFGFLPRFILGLLFGYLFLWSGTLWLPVISHFVNNGVSVIAEYIQKGENVNAVPDNSICTQITGLIVPVIISLIILLYFRNNRKKRTEINLDMSKLSDS